MKVTVMSYHSVRSKRMSRKKGEHGRPGVPSEFSDSARGVRLQKALADAGIASRRECEAVVQQGRVRVNDKLVTALPAFVDLDQDLITVDGKSLAKLTRGPAKHQRKICIMLNKPRRVISTVDDPQGRRTVLDLVDINDAPRLYPVGRLDADSTGLILLTNDGDLAQQLTHPSFQVPKCYRVSIRGRLEDSDIEKLKNGLMLTQKRKGSRPVKRAQMGSVKKLSYGRSASGERTRLEITLYEGQNREIRRLLAKLEFKVRRLERVSIGPLNLKGLASGHWRLLSDKEVRMLRNSARPDANQKSDDTAADAREQKSTYASARPARKTTARPATQTAKTSDAKPTARGSKASAKTTSRGPRKATDKPRPTSRGPKKSSARPAARGGKTSARPTKRASKASGSLGKKRRR